MTNSKHIDNVPDTYWRGINNQHHNFVLGNSQLKTPLQTISLSVIKSLFLTFSHFMNSVLLPEDVEKKKKALHGLIANSTGHLHSKLLQLVDEMYSLMKRNLTLSDDLRHKNVFQLEQHFYGKQAAVFFDENASKLLASSDQVKKVINELQQLFQEQTLNEFGPYVTARLISEFRETLLRTKEQRMAELKGARTEFDELENTTFSAIMYKRSWLFKEVTTHRFCQALLQGIYSAKATLKAAELQIELLDHVLAKLREIEVALGDWMTQFDYVRIETQKAFDKSIQEIELRDGQYDLKLSTIDYFYFDVVQSIVQNDGMEMQTLFLKWWKSLQKHGVEALLAKLSDYIFGTILENPIFHLSFDEELSRRMNFNKEVIDYSDLIMNFQKYLRDMCHIQSRFRALINFQPENQLFYLGVANSDVINGLLKKHNFTSSEHIIQSNPAEIELIRVIGNFELSQLKFWETYQAKYDKWKSATDAKLHVWQQFND
jgi:hypothetical protein